MKPIILGALALLAAAGAAEAQQRGPGLDANGDGKITLQEFQASRGDRMFKRMDVDSDGKLSKAELQMMLDRAPQGADAAFAALDADKDGFVIRAEADAAAAAMFGRADTDDDGALSRDEIESVRMGMRGPGGPR
ncbi:EF-hand domain-containing protein [Phenylobacterium immobile]|uniref:EF-hand domain-containing protein n=1 Tax=Phenylobacterium immobile TaxID=21 RepID=UPI000B32ACBF|nr:EF-hand domain-containing protein [Phenylobacterium immobile]